MSTVYTVHGYLSQLDSLFDSLFENCPKIFFKFLNFFYNFSYLTYDNLATVTCRACPPPPQFRFFCCQLNEWIGKYLVAERLTALSHSSAGFEGSVLNSVIFKRAA